MADRAPEFQEISMSWCKKEDVRPTHSLLLVCDNIICSTTDTLTLALYQTINHLTSVSRREKEDKTLLLLEFDQAVKKVTLPLKGEFKLTVADQTIFVLDTSI